jgi:hypothetical protein
MQENVELRIRGDLGENESMAQLAKSKMHNFNYPNDQYRLTFFIVIDMFNL